MMQVSVRSSSFASGTNFVVFLFLVTSPVIKSQDAEFPDLATHSGSFVKIDSEGDTHHNWPVSASITNGNIRLPAANGNSIPMTTMSSTDVSSRRLPISERYPSKELLSTGDANCQNRTRCSGPGPRQEGPTLKLAFMTTCQKDHTKNYLGLKISGAFALAVDEVNKRGILPMGYKIEYEVLETASNLLRSVGQVCQGSLSNVSAFFGPSESCEIETVVAASVNKPVLSYACGELPYQDFGNFVRFNPMERTVLSKLIAMFSDRSWKKFRVLFSYEYQSLAHRIKAVAVRQNLTPLPMRQVSNLEEIVETFETTHNETRIYVVLCPKTMVNQFLLGMFLSGLLNHSPPLYLLVFLDLEASQESEWSRSIWGNYRSTLSATTRQALLRKYSNSLLVIRGADPKTDFKRWRELVLEKNKQSPFCLTQYGGQLPALSAILFPPNDVPYLQTAYLYDSVIQYAMAVNRSYWERIESDVNVTLEEVAKDGRKIVEQMRNLTFISAVLNDTMHLDIEAENEGIYRGYVLYSCTDCGRKKLPRDPKLNIDANASAPNLADSQYGEERSLTSRYSRIVRKKFLQHICNASFWNETRDENWNLTGVEEIACFVEVIYFRGQQAISSIAWHLKDEPECGFGGCQKTNLLRMGWLWALAGFLALQWFYGMLHYAIYRAEIKITGLEWKIAQHEIECISHGRTRESTRSLAMQTSSAGLLFYNPMGRYQGILVCLKPGHLSSPRQGFSRALKKEICLIRKMSHQNLCRFYGICVDAGTPILVSEYRERGSLQDVLKNELAFLDEAFLDSLLYDLVKGMTYLHDMYGPHGELTASNCVVTGRWVLQIADYGLKDLRRPARLQDSFKKLYKLLYRPPELLRKTVDTLATKEGDVYSFGIILHEALGGEGPFSLQDALLDGDYEVSLKGVLDGVRRGPTSRDPLVRPNVTSLVEKPFGTNKDVLNLMKKCWAEDPTERPLFKEIKADFHKMTKQQRSGNLMDHLVSMMEKHSNNLEKLIEARTKELMEEKKLTEQLLYSMLPRTVAESLKHGIAVEPQSFERVTIYFSDIVGFTALSSESTPMQIVTFLDDLYRMFDGIISGYDVYKVETIGDAYMVVSGLPVKNDLRHAGEIASMALELLDKTQNHFKIAHRPDQSLNLRVGLHTGPVMAGVVGLSMPRYCLFGDTVNTAARMESNGSPNKIHISSACREALEELDGYVMEIRGLVEMKGKGQLVTHWLLRTTPKAIKRRKSRKISMAPMFQRPGEFHRMSQSSSRLSYGEDQPGSLPRIGTHPLVDRHRLVNPRRRCSSISNMPSEVVRRSYQRRLGVGTLPPASSVDTLPPHLRSRGNGIDHKVFTPLLRSSLVPASQGTRRSHPTSPLVESVL